MLGSVVMGSGKLDLAKDAKNKKGFYRYHNQKKKEQEGVASPSE